MPRQPLVAWSLLLLVALGCSPSGDGASGTAAVVWHTLPDGARISSEQIARFDALFTAVDEAYASEDYEACIDRSDEALAIYDGNDRVWFVRSYCQALAGHVDGAIASLEKGVERFGGGADRIENDSDFDSLREAPAYRALIERAEALDAIAATADPMRGDAEAGGPWTSLGSIRSAFARVPRDPLAFLLGTAQQRRQVHRFQRDHVAALRAYIAEHPDDAAARFAEIEALEAFDPPTPQAAEAFERFATEHQDGPWYGVTAIRQAIEPYDDVVFADAGHPDHEVAYRQVLDVARGVVEAYPDAGGSRDAWLWLVRDGLRRRDADTVRPAFTALETHWADNIQFWDEHREVLSIGRFVAQGLPEFETTTLDGETISLASLRGQVVLLDFWATWCGPCLDQLPDLKAVYAEHHAAGFEIVGISADHADRMDEATFRQWIADQDMTWPQIYSGEGWEEALFQDFGIEGIPTTLLLDRQGRVAGVDLYGEALRDTVAALLRAATVSSD